MIKLDLQQVTFCMVLVVFFIVNFAVGQTSDYDEAVMTNNIEELSPLTVGDKVPEVVLNNMLYYSKSGQNLSDFKGKLVILDFGQLVRKLHQSFPHMDSLVKKFGDQLQIILVNPKSWLTKDDSAKITRIMKNKSKELAVLLNYLLFITAVN